MSHQRPSNDNDKNNRNDSEIKPEPETLHTSDPQKKMEGPISSLMHQTGNSFDTKKSKEEADKEKEDEDK